MLLNKLIKEYKKDADYIYERLKYDISEQIYELMRKKGITKKELAKRMGVSPAYISKILGAENISLKTIAKVLAALGEENVTLKIIPDDAEKISNSYEKKKIYLP